MSRAVVNQWSGLKLHHPSDELNSKFPVVVSMALSLCQYPKYPQLLELTDTNRKNTSAKFRFCHVKQNMISSQLQFSICVWLSIQKVQILHIILKHYYFTSLKYLEKLIQS